jgi:hypothetical protein
MRSFNFKAKLIGEEKYLTYTMGEETELDEDVLDYCEENDLKELVKIIYEEDDDYDYLTYDITGQHTIDELLSSELRCEDVLVVLRNIANGLISLKEQAVKLNYILLNRQFMYVNDNLDIKFICLPVESGGGLAAEFKGFVRQFLANIRYDVDEDLNYVGKLLTYINGDSFNLRGLVGLSEALMEEAGVSFEEVGGIEADGVEVMNSEEVEPESDGIKDFMESFAEAGTDEPLPEIGDDEEDEEEDVAETDDGELDSILPAGMKFDNDETENEPESEAVNETVDEAVNEADDRAEAAGDDVTEKPEVKLESEPEADKQESEAAVESSPEPESDSEVKSESEPESDSKVKPEVKLESEQKSKTASEAVGNEADEAETGNEAGNEIGIEIRETAAPASEEKGRTDNLKKAEESVEPVKKEAPVKDAKLKETDPEVLKSRIKALAGTEKDKAEKPVAFKTEQDMDTYFGSKPPVIKKNSVKVNRAAIIQNIAASEEEAELAAKEKEEQQVPVIEEISESINQEKKPKSNSILSKTVEAPKPQTANVVNIAKAIPYLVRVNTNERVMLRKEVFKIGKASIGVDYTVAGNGAISRQHAVIIRRDDVSYIKDNKSTNHTYVNDKRVEDGEEVILTHDSMIRLGDEEFVFKIR